MQYLNDFNRDNAQLLINRLYALPTEVHPTVAHHVITLLPKTNTALPREKPVRLCVKWNGQCRFVESRELCCGNCGNKTASIRCFDMH